MLSLSVSVALSVTDDGMIRVMKLVSETELVRYTVLLRPFTGGKVSEQP